MTKRILFLTLCLVFVFIICFNSVIDGRRSSSSSSKTTKSSKTKTTSSASSTSSSSNTTASVTATSSTSKSTTTGSSTSSASSTVNKTSAPIDLSNKTFILPYSPQNKKLTNNTDFMFSSSFLSPNDTSDIIYIGEARFIASPQPASSTNATDGEIDINKVASECKNKRGKELMDCALQKLKNASFYMNSTMVSKEIPDQQNITLDGGDSNMSIWKEPLDSAYLDGVPKEDTGTFDDILREDDIYGAPSKCSSRGPKISSGCCSRSIKTVMPISSRCDGAAPPVKSTMKTKLQSSSWVKSSSSCTNTITGHQISMQYETLAKAKLIPTTSIRVFGCSQSDLSPISLTSTLTMTSTETSTYTPTITQISTSVLVPSMSIVMSSRIVNQTISYLSVSMKTTSYPVQRCIPTHSTTTITGVSEECHLAKTTSVCTLSKVNVYTTMISKPFESSSLVHYLVTSRNMVTQAKPVRQVMNYTCQYTSVMAHPTLVFPDEPVKKQEGRCEGGLSRPSVTKMNETKSVKQCESVERNATAPIKTKRVHHIVKKNVTVPARPEIVQKVVTRKPSQDEMKQYECHTGRKKESMRPKYRQDCGCQLDDDYRVPPMYYYYYPQGQIPMVSPSQYTMEQSSMVPPSVPVTSIPSSMPIMSSVSSFASSVAPSLVAGGNVSSSSASMSSNLTSLSIATGTEAGGAIGSIGGIQSSSSSGGAPIIASSGSIDTGTGAAIGGSSAVISANTTSISGGGGSSEGAILTSSSLIGGNYTSISLGSSGIGGIWTMPAEGGVNSTIGYSNTSLITSTGKSYGKPWTSIGGGSGGSNTSIIMTPPSSSTTKRTFGRITKSPTTVSTGHGHSSYTGVTPTAHTSRSSLLTQTEGVERSITYSSSTGQRHSTSTSSGIGAPAPIQTGKSSQGSSNIGAAPPSSSKPSSGGPSIAPAPSSSSSSRSSTGGSGSGSSNLGSSSGTGSGSAPGGSSGSGTSKSSASK